MHAIEESFWHRQHLQDGVADFHAARCQCIDGECAGKKALAGIEIERFAPLREVRGIDSLARPQTHGSAFEAIVFRRNAFDSRRRDFARKTRIGRRGRPHQAEPSMRTLAERGVVLASPDGHVVAALESRPGVVGNFITLQPEVGQQTRKKRDAIHQRIVVRDGFKASFHECAELRALFHNEGIHARMLEIPLGKARVARRGRSGVAREAGDEVDACVVEVFLDERKRAFGVMERIHPAHLFEDCIVERLDAHRDSIDAAGLEAGKRFAPDVEGMELDRKLRIPRKMRRKRIEQRLKIAESGRTAAEIDGRKQSFPIPVATSEPLPPLQKLPHPCGKRGDIFRSGLFVDADARVECAILALAPAKREMQVEVHENVANVKMLPVPIPNSNWY